MRTELEEGARNQSRVGKPRRHGEPVLREPSGLCDKQAWCRARLKRVALGRARRRHRARRESRERETFGEAESEDDRRPGENSTRSDAFSQPSAFFLPLPSPTYSHRAPISPIEPRHHGA
jgi:hypothetical protein